MSEALKSGPRAVKVKTEAGCYTADLLIAGRSLPSRSGRRFTRTNPCSADIVTNAAAACEDDVDAAACSAAAAFPYWSRTSPQQRSSVLEQAALLLAARADEFARVMLQETGATLQWCHFNIEMAVRVLTEAASCAGEVARPDLTVLQAGSGSLAIRQPAGVCLAIAPWNAPILLAVRSFAYAIGWGNTVVLKTSELCPATQRLLGDVMQDAGLQAGVLNILSNAPEDARRIVGALIAHPVIRRINFTGSTRVGRTIAEMAARHLKRCLLELGGKAPLIVLADADLDAAADAAVYGAFFNQGQICISTERIIVEHAVADTFLARMVERTRLLKAGDPAIGHMPLGALISAESGRRLANLIEDATARGATVSVGGGVYDVMMDATIVEGVTSSMRLYREESFGPIAAVVRVADAEEAITVANDCEYGLSGAVFSQDIERAVDVALRVETGIMHINGATVADDPSMPFGGVKASGYGRFGGISALDEFTELRWITRAVPGNTYHI
jgi:vanillin dehydrogenase